jgi:transcriptional regulator with XRE-family HTH domain
MSEFRKAKKAVDVTPGESVKILRELQELSQNELAKLTGIPQSTISAIENDRVRLGVERSKVLARALGSGTCTKLSSSRAGIPWLGYQH